MKWLITALLLTSACTLSVKKENPRVLSLSAQKAKHATSSKQYAPDCGKRVNKRFQSFAQLDAGIPGAGMGKIVPFETVLKDGFAEMDCFKDDLFYHGDKFHDHKASYTNRFNVSIVHYTTVVAKEDRQQMTQEVCFDFCRTVPDMFGFGILNGRECYCAPYAQQIAGDSSECDAQCEGNPAQLCGGKTKSTIFSMHMCADTEGDLKSASTNLNKTFDELTDATKRVSSEAARGTQTALELQKLFGCLGDSAAPDMLQKANVDAGVLEEAARVSNKLLVKMAAAQGDVSKMLGMKLDFTDFSNLKKAEELIGNMEKFTMEGSGLVPGLHKFLRFQDVAATPEGAKAMENRSELFYQAYHFVHPETPQTKWAKDKSSCSGPLAADPIFGLSEDECAYACDEIANTCKGYQWFDKHTSICLLLEEVEELHHYDQCSTLLPPRCLPVVIKGKEDKASLLQQAAPVPWKTKSTTPNATLFGETVKGMCTRCDGCGSPGSPLFDCDLMPSYECKRTGREEVTDAGGLLSMQFVGSVPTGRRNGACTENPNPCPSCKQFTTCVGPYAITEEVEIKQGDVASYTWSSSGAVDDYEVFVGLYSSTCGLVDYQFQRGKKQPFETFELFSPKTDKYHMKFLLGSYDGSGGGAVGADMKVKDVKTAPATIPKDFSTASSQCKVRAKDFFGITIKPTKVSKQCLKPDGTYPLGDNRCGIPEKKELL